jgi:hypothetical protein
MMAASMSSEALQKAIVESTHNFFTNGRNGNPLGTYYAVDGPDRGQWLFSKAKATVGGHFALMAQRLGRIM